MGEEGVHSVICSTVHAVSECVHIYAGMCVRACNHVSLKLNMSLHICMHVYVHMSVWKSENVCA